MFLVVSRAVFIGTPGVLQDAFSFSTIIKYLTESMAVRYKEDISKPPFLPKFVMWAMKFRRKYGMAASRNLP